MSKKLTDVLNKKLDFTNNSPIDIFFQELDNFFGRIDQKDSKTSIYDDLQLNNDQLVDTLISYFERICRLVSEKQEENNDLIPISLHDMKHFDTLVNLLVIHGINANLPVPIQIPLEQRRLDSFRDENKLYKLDVIPTAGKCSEALKRVLLSFENILLNAPTSHYVRKILLKGGPGYADTLIGYMSLMYAATSSVDAKAYEQKLRQLEKIKDTYSLFEIYSLFLSTIKNDKFKYWPLNRLSLLVVERDDGLISLVDFIVGVREDDQVDTSKFERVNRIVLAKPKTLTSVQYFDKLFVQIYECFTHVDKPILISCLNGIVTAFYLRNKRIVRDFLFTKINKVLYNTDNTNIPVKDVNNVINVLISVGRTTYTDLITDMIASYKNGQDFYLNLWIYAMFLKRSQKSTPKNEGDPPYYNIILGLIKTYMVVTDNYKDLDIILSNMVNYDHDTWEYRIDLETQLPYISTKDQNISEGLGIGKLSVEEETTKKFQKMLMDIDPAVDLFIELLTKIDDQQVNKSIFSAVTNSWLKQIPNLQTENIKPLQKVGNEEDEDDSSFADNIQSMIFLKVLERMNEVFKSNLLTEPSDLLVIILQILEFAKTNKELPTEPDSDDEDDEDDGDDEQLMSPSDTFGIALKLLNSVLPTFHSACNEKEKTLLTSIRQKTINLKSAAWQNIVRQIDDILAQEPSYQDDDDDDDKNNDKALLKKALANINDPLVPIRAHGLLQLRQLLQKRSKQVDIKKVFMIHITQLHDQDPFIYLNVIRGLGMLIDIRPDETLQLLFKAYRAKESKSSVDDILKIGEVLMNYVSVQGETFTGKNSAQLISICLENVKEKERVDNRVRMSSMSILGKCLELNALGIQDFIGDILDCAFGILTFETNTDSDDEDIKKNSAIMRRSAVHLIYDLLSNSGLGLFPESYGVEKVKTTLSYIKSQDNDFLVCEQIGTVLNQIDIHLQNSMIPDNINSPSLKQLQL